MRGEQTTILCMSSYFKGNDFIRGAKNEGCKVILMTVEKIAHDAWAFDQIDQVFLMPSLENVGHVINAVTYLSRTQKIDRVIPLDEFDLETAALLREHMLLPGMNFSETRPFRDKLAMRQRAKDHGVPVPEFTGVFHHHSVFEWMQEVPAPWVLKPRLNAGAIGIKKIANQEELWYWLEQLGDEQSYRLLERYIPGEVYHVDSIVWDGKIKFTSAQKYGRPPMDVAHGGGVFTTRVLLEDHPDHAALMEINEQVLKALGAQRCVTHAEYIKRNDTGEFIFLECAARVGGAHIADLIEASTGINLWREWARITVADARGEKYKLPKTKRENAALLVCLSKQEHPDLSGYNDPEVAWRLDMPQHAGLVIATKDNKRVENLLESYIDRFAHDFLAVAPPREKPTH
jgi:biotin carboxylase